MAIVNRSGLTTFRIAAVLGCALALAWAERADAAPLKIACIGEQTTHSDQLNRAVEYPAMLQTALGSDYDVENFGDCCATVLSNYPKQAETHPYLLGGGKPSYNESITFAPDVVVIGSWGKHDTEIANALTSGIIDPAQFTKDYEALLAAYMSLPHKPVIYLSTPVPIPKGAATGPTTDVILPTVRAAAAKYQLPIVDLYAAFLNQPQLYKDDTHVTNVEGLQRIADAVHAALAASSAPSDAGVDAPLQGSDASTDDDAGAPQVPLDAAPPHHATPGDAAGSEEQPSNGSGGCSAAATREPIGARGGAVFGMGIALAMIARRRARSSRARATTKTLRS